ncbi:MAG: hypothetical protein HYW62_03940 [Candidatus Levybacteria bacterium]|nr:hypothetical protein [Candidatus Levybacteria bacterium]
MDTTKAKQITDYIFKDVFGMENPFSLGELQRRFAMDIPLPQKVVSALSKKDTWTNSSVEKIASQEEIGDRFKKDEWTVKKKPLRSIQDILKAWEEINYLTGEKYINSRDIIESDSVYNSSDVYRSMSIFDSKNIVFSYKLFDSNYMLASRDNSSCTLGIRVKEAIFCSSGFEISWSNKVSKSMYIHDSFDLFECLFCSHLRSKKYCIANMQFEKEEYFELKKQVVDWILK